MVQVVPQSSRSAMAGQQAASGVANALNYLAQQKAAQMQGRHELARKQEEQQGAMEALSSMGLPPQLALLDPTLAKSVLAQQEKQQELEAFQQRFGGGQAQGAHQMQQARPGRAGSAPGEEEVAEVGYTVTPSGEVEGEEGILVAPWDPQLAGPTVSGQEVAAAGGIRQSFGEGIKFQGQQELQQQKIALQRAEHDYKRNEKWVDKLESRAEASEETLRALDLANDAVNSGELGPWSKAAFAEALPDHGFLGMFKRVLTPSTAAQFKSASKTLLKSLKEIFGARPTNLDVTMLDQMFAKIGQSEAANRMANKILQMQPQADKMKAKIFDEIRRKNPKASTTQLRDATKKAYDQWADGHWEQAMKDVKAINGGFVPVRGPEGQVAYVRENDLDAARADGWELR